MSENKTIYSRWIKRGTNTFLPTDNSQIVGEVDAGLYELRVAEGIGFYMLKRDVHLDELLEFPSNIHRGVLDSIKTFWERKDKFAEYGFAFKRGILLHGKPGCGKSCIIQLCMKYAISELNAVILSLQGNGDMELYCKSIPEIFRVIEKDRPIVIVLEDIENLCQNRETEGMLLNVLDGLDQLENVIYLATTNYIEMLKERIINRPSRFDRRIYVPFLSEEDRIFYFKNKLKDRDFESNDIKKWAADTEGMSIAHLAELIKSVVIFGTPYDETIDILKEMNEFQRLHSSQYEKGGDVKVGFKTHTYIYSQPAEAPQKSGNGLKIHAE